jgi:hypothetical protein
MPREILVDWTTINGAGKVSVFHFIEASSVASQRAALATFLGAVDAYLDNSTTWTIRTAGREVLSATGALTGAWTESTAYTGTGASSGEPAADATQVLFRWLTDHIVGSRFLQGRTFIPGIEINQLSGGNLLAATRTALTTAGQTLIDSSVQLAVWHRPVNGAGGEAWAADTCAVSSEFAVLRRRRG